MKCRDLTRHNTTVLHDAVFEVESEHAPFCREQGLLATGQPVLHGLSDLERHGARDVVTVDVVLRSETAADRSTGISNLIHR